MPKKQLPELPEELGAYIDQPYGGLFGDNAQTKIIEEVVADPYRSYRLGYFKEMTGKSEPSIRKALNNLTTLKLLEKDISDIQHPIYRANLKSKKLVALTFLSLASIDDRDNTDCMDFAVLDYYLKVLKDKVQLSAFATIIKYEIQGMQLNDTFVAGVGETNKESMMVVTGTA